MRKSTHQAQSNEAYRDVRILLLEDDPLLGDGIRVGLLQDGYAVDWFVRGQDAEHALDVEHFDLMVLDLGLPDRDGLEVLARLRHKGSDIPVVVLTARDTIGDRVQGLDVGADDYMVKPFDLDELSARVRALIRRSKGRATPEVVVDGLVLQPASHLVLYKDRALELSPKEFALLQILMEHAGQVVSRATLQQSLYGWDQDIESNAVEVHIHHLRKKIGAEWIRTVRGVGYQLQRDD